MRIKKKIALLLATVTLATSVAVAVPAIAEAATNGDAKTPATASTKLTLVIGGPDVSNWPTELHTDCGHPGFSVIHFWTTGETYEEKGTESAEGREFFGSSKLDYYKGQTEPSYQYGEPKKLSKFEGGKVDEKTWYYFDNASNKYKKCVKQSAPQPQANSGASVINTADLAGDIKKIENKFVASSQLQVKTFLSASDFNKNKVEDTVTSAVNTTTDTTANTTTSNLTQAEKKAEEQQRYENFYTKMFNAKFSSTKEMSFLQKLLSAIYYTIDKIIK